MNIDCTLNTFTVPGIPGLDIAFGTKRPNMGHMSTREHHVNAAMALSLLRPHIVNEDSTTTEFEANHVFDIVTAGVTLELNSAAYNGCKAYIVNSSNDSASVLAGNDEITLFRGDILDLEFVNGKWNRRCGEKENLRMLTAFEYTADDPVVASTENVTLGGNLTIDGVHLETGDRVFLKDQTDPTQNGYWIVQSGQWNRDPSYSVGNSTAFTGKFISPIQGSQKGKVFFLIEDSYAIGTNTLNFMECAFSASSIPGKSVIRDKNGRAQVSAPEAVEDIARKKEVDDVQKNLDLARSASLVRPGRNLLQVLNVETVQEVMEILHQRCNDEGIPDFSGLNIGDYLDLPSLTVDGTVYTQNLRILVSGFNIFRNPLNVQGARNIKNHILFTFDSIVLKKRMNAANNNAGGYPASELRIFLEGATGDGSGPFAVGLKNVIGDYLYTIRRYTSTKGAMAWNNYTVFLPTDKEVGAPYYWDGGGYYPGDERDDYELQTRWPIYLVRPYQKMYNGTNLNDPWWWLSSPHAGSSTYFCLVNSYGLSYHAIASNAAGGVAPAFCVA